MSARADEWLELKTPYFTVLSEASEGKTRDWATEFELFRRALSIVMPLDPAAMQPVTLVLFRSDRRLRPFKPVENGKPSAVAGYFARVGGNGYIALSAEGARDDVREVLFHEATHWYLAASDRPRPAWLEEGLAEAFGNFRLSGKSFVLGSTRADSVHYVRAFRAMPFAKLMEIESGRMNYNGSHAAHAQMFYQQSWALAHALVFGDGGLGTVALGRYFGRPAEDPDPLRDFEKGFGVDAAGMDEMLAGYLLSGRFRVVTLPLDRTGIQEQFSVSRAPAAQVDLLLANLLLGTNRTADAEPYLARASKALPADPRVAEAYAQLNLRQRRWREAEEHLRETLRRGGKSFFAHFMLGQFLLENEAVTLSTRKPDVTASVEHLIAALRVNPRYLPAAESLAEIIPIARTVPPEANATLEAAAQRFPTSGKVQLGVAYLAWQAGDQGRARMAATQARKALPAMTSAERRLAETLLSQIEDGLPARPPFRPWRQGDGSP